MRLCKYVTSSLHHLIVVKLTPACASLSPFGQDLSPFDEKHYHHLVKSHMLTVRWRLTPGLCNWYHTPGLVSSMLWIFLSVKAKWFSCAAFYLRWETTFLLTIISLKIVNFHVVILNIRLRQWLTVLKRFLEAVHALIQILGGFIILLYSSNWIYVLPNLHSFVILYVLINKNIILNKCFIK